MTSLISSCGLKRTAIMKLNEFKRGIDMEVAYINDIGNISWKYDKLVWTLMPVKTLEFPFRIFKSNQTKKSLGK